MTALSIRSAAIAALLVMTACAGPTGDPQKSASKTLGVEGGQVTAPNGVGVSIPSGALRKATLITVAPAAIDAVRPTAPAVGDMYEFGPEGLTFNVPAKVTLQIDISRLPAGYSITDVVVQRAPLGTSAFELIPTRVIDSNHVECDTLHFSVFIPTLDSARGSDGGTDGGTDGGVTCAERCVTPNDGGADCECSRVCGQETVEIVCSGSSPLGCACVRNGVQVGFVSTNVCPAASDIDRLCGASLDAGVDGGVIDDGGVVDGGFADAGTDGGIRADGGTDGGVFTDGGSPDGGATDGGTRPDGGVTDGGTFDGGFPDGGAIDGGSFDGGFSDAGTPDGGFSDGGTAVDAGTSDAGTRDGGAADGGSADAGVP